MCDTAAQIDGKTKKVDKSRKTYVQDRMDRRKECSMSAILNLYSRIEGSLKVLRAVSGLF